MKGENQFVNASLFLFRLISVFIIFVTSLVFPLAVHADLPVNPVPVPSFDLPFNVDHSGTTTWYSMNLVSGQGITVVLNAHLNSEYIDFGIYDGEGTSLSDTGYDEFYNGETGVLSKTIEESEVYYIKVWGSSGAVGNYDLAVYNAWFNAGATDSQRDFYSSQNTARYLENNEYHVSPLKVEWYRFTVLQDAQLDASITAHLNSGYIDFGIYDGEGTSLSDTGYDEFYNGETGRLNKTIKESGVYYIKVWGSSGVVGYYDLHVLGADVDIDSDSDGLFDAAEYYHVTKIDNSDTDGDGVSDIEELLQGRNPKIATEYSKDDVYSAITQATALPIPFFDLPFNIDHSGTTTWYSMNLVSGQGITVVLNAHLNSEYIDFGIYNGEGTSLSDTGYDEFYNGETGVFSKTIEESGVYYIKVWGSSGAVGNYDLAVYNAWFNAGATDSQRDFYSSQNTARYLENNEYHVSPLKVEWYRFTVLQDAQLDASITAHLNSGYIDFGIYDGEGTSLSDTGYDEFYNGETGRLNKTIKESGVYYIKVWGSSGVVGYYDLHVLGADVDIDSDSDGLFDAAEYYHVTKIDNSDTDGDGVSDIEELLQGRNPKIATEYSKDDVYSAITQATALPVPFFDLPFNIDHSGTTTWFSMNLVSGQGITVVLNAHLNSEYIDFGIYDGEGTSLSDTGYDEFYNGETGVLSKTIEESEVYYIKVWGSSGAVGNYDLAVYNAWFNAGATDSQRDFYSSQNTARYLENNEYHVSPLKVEWYRFTVLQDAQLDASITAHLNSGYIDFGIYDGEGTSLSDTGYDEFYNGETGRLNKTIEESGVYYIKVWGSSGAVGYYDFNVLGADVFNSSLSGILRDATTNKPISGITITVDGIHTDVTDENGYYSFFGLSPGVHTIEVTVPSGYSKYVRTMEMSDNPTWNIFLTKPQTVYGGETSSGYGPDPVNTAIGNYIYNRKDMEIPGKGMAFVFYRYYNSQDGEDGPLGFGWGHTYSTALTINADSSVTIQWGDGKTETWTPNSSGLFMPQHGVFDTLIENSDGSYTLKKKDLTKYAFDTSGRLSNITDKNSNRINLAYTESCLTRITDTAGRNLDLTYDENGHITQVADPIGREFRFAYVDGNLVSATDMNGNVTAYAYDDTHQMITVIDPKENIVVTNTYDVQRRVVTSQSDAKGGQTTYLYDEVNKKASITDPLGNTYYHYHDELLRLIREENALGNSSYYSYDFAGNRTEVIDRNGNATIYTYDLRGNVLTKTDALGNVTTITYDSNNNPLTRTDALGNTAAFEYDASGNLKKAIDPFGHFTTTTYNSNGQPVIIKDKKDNAITYAYDAEGNLTEVKNALGNKTTYTYDGVSRRITATDPLDRTTSYIYDNNNNFLSVIDPLGNITSNTYDANDNRITNTDPLGNMTRYTYDVKDLLETIVDPLGNAISYTYDGLDRKISATDKNGNAAKYAYDEKGNLISITDALNNSTSYTYDPNGNKLSETDPLGLRTTYTYDAMNRVTSIMDPLGNTTTNTYDALGRVTATMNAKNQTTDFDYDALGRLLKVTDAEEGVLTYIYDENGNRISMTDPNGNTTSYTYDAVNKLIRKTEAMGNTYRYAYDAQGNMTSHVDANDNTLNYTYDANDRLVQITYPDALIVRFTYDANGNRTSMVDSLGETSYTYDSLNRLTSYTDPFEKSVGYDYDPNGNRTSITYPGGKAVTYSFDSLNRLIWVTDWLSNKTNYAYNATDRLTNILNPNNTKVTYTYDAAGRLTQLLNAKSDQTVISSYAYTLDALGNHIQVVKNEPLPIALADSNITYTYDAENRLTDAGGTIHTYNANGNLTARGSDAFGYDFNNRLMQSNIDGMITQYNYDGLGNRLSKTVNGTETRYVLDINGSLSNVLAEADDTGAITAYYVYGLGLISKIFPDGTAWYYHYDSRGSTVAMTDAEENITDAYAYEPFGTLSDSAGSTQNPFKYVGRYGVVDDGNGLNYIRARYYAPEVGRFITKDPITGRDGDSQSLNRYVYALNNPVMLIDISGFCAEKGIRWKNTYGASDGYHDYLLEIDEIEADWWYGMGKLSAGLLSKAPDWKIVSVSGKTGKYWRRVPHVGTAGKIAKALSYKVVYDLIKGGDQEFKRRGYTGNDFKESILNIDDNIKYAIENPDAALDAVTEGVTSATAVTINCLTFDVFDVSGQQIEDSISNIMDKPTDWLGNKFYQWGW